MTRLISQTAFRLLAISVATLAVLTIVGRSTNASLEPGSARSSAATAQSSGIFYTVTGTADNTDVVIHGGTGTQADPFQMSSLRGAVLNGNTIVTTAVGPVTIFVPAGTYPLSVNNPNTPAVTGTIAFPDLQVGSTTNHNTRIVGTGGTPTIQQTVGGNDVITTGFAANGFTPVVVNLTLENLAITGGGFSGIFTGVDNGTERSSTTLINCNVHGNSNPFGQGGGIFNQTGDLTVQGSTFSNNTASQQGGAIFFSLPNSNGSPGTFGSLIVTDSTFTNNTASATNNVAGGAIAIFVPNRIENTYSITGSSFANNHANGAASKGGGVGSGGQGTVNVTLSRFVGNTAMGGGSGAAGQGAAPINAINNWWGCDDIPGSAGCDTTSGSVTASPRIDLALGVAPGALCPSSSRVVTADVSKNDSGTTINPTVMNGLTVTFGVIGGPAGSSVSPTSATISGFTASTTFTAGSSSGSATVTATVDNGTEDVTVDVSSSTTTSDPADQAVCQGTDANFSTTASGTGPFSYAWTVDGSPVGGDSPNVTVPTGSLSLGNHTVEVTVTGACGSATQSATLTINTPTSTSDPADQTVCQGAMANFSTTASGTGPFSYAWTVDGSPTGSDSPNLSVDTTSLSAGNHTVSVTTTGACGSDTESATLTVQATTTTTDPADQTVCQGAMANFSTTASGTGPFSYAWTVDGSPTGTDSPNLSVDTTSLSVGNHTVSVTTTGACGSVSQSATLTVQATTTTTDPADQAACQGAMANFSTTASGTGPFSYAWTLDGSPYNGNSSSISVDTTGLSVGNHTVSVTTTGTCGSATQSATLTVNAPTATTDPADQTVCEGATANFSTTASGTGPFHYAWTVDGLPAGTDSPNLSVNTTGFTQGAHTVTVTTTGTCGSASQTATLTVSNSPPVITVTNSLISVWPPNHDYQNFTLSDFGVTATSGCEGDITNRVVIASVTSDELDDNPGGADGSTINDIVIAGDCKSVQLRRERDGNANGRVYTITFRVTDSVGNTTTATAQVTVPINRGGAGAVGGPPLNTVIGTCP